MKTETPLPRATGKLQEHLEFEGLISQIAALVVDASPKALDATIETALGLLGEHLGLGLATVLCVAPAGMPSR
jgi:hypothetical protein